MIFVLFLLDVQINWEQTVLGDNEWCLGCSCRLFAIAQWDQTMITAYLKPLYVQIWPPLDFLKTDIDYVISVWIIYMQLKQVKLHKGFVQMVITMWCLCACLTDVNTVNIWPHPRLKHTALTGCDTDITETWMNSVQHLKCVTSPFFLFPVSEELKLASQKSQHLEEVLTFPSFTLCKRFPSTCYRSGFVKPETVIWLIGFGTVRTDFLLLRRV